ncbi:MAG TPA: hypothetical protein VEI97_13715, partial [bacterium]|nr:hypothetical protein [bacterium]
RPVLVGLPLGAIDQGWAQRLALEGREPPASLAAAFPGFIPTVAVALAPEAEVVVHLEPEAPVVEGFRVQARSETLLMATLDPVEEALLAQAHLVLGQPVAVVQAERRALAAEFAALAAAHRIARRFKVTSPKVTLAFSEVRATEVLVTVGLESTAYHLRAEAFVDIGNDRTPAEFQAHGGYLVGPVELFGVLNVLTEEPTVAPDLGLGFSSGPYFAGGAWDVQEGALKYFVSFSPVPILRLSAEGYADREEHEGQDQFGALYQPTQQLGVGLFTDAGGLWWARASFRL